MKFYWLVTALPESFLSIRYTKETLITYSRVILYQKGHSHPAYSFNKLAVKRRL